MKVLRKVIAFVLVFSLLAGTVAAISAAVFDNDASDAPAPIGAMPAVPADDDMSPDETTGYRPRLTAPSKSNPYYYSDYNAFYLYGWGMPNCTCYAWGRAYEITGQEPQLSLYSAYLWYDENIACGAYPYGTEPKLGAIACWVYTSGVSGHVAVVEKIENGVITFSNSAYCGTEFYTSTAPVDDPSDGRETWIFQGYIYICDYDNPADESTDDPLGDPSAEPAGGDKPFDGVYYRVADEDGVNLRRGAGTGYSVIGWIGYDERVLVTAAEKSGGYTWGRTEHNGSLGWFALDFAVAQEEASPPAEENFKLGDLDADGCVTVLDATRIQLILAELMQPTQYMLTVGDYDGDKELSILDATRIRYDIAYDKIH